MTLSPSEAIVLAGGEGTRLRDALPGVPKVLAPIGGRPYLHRLLNWLAGQGLASAVVATGYAAETVEASASQWSGPLDVTFSREPERLGTGGAIALAFERVRGERAWVFNGDSFCDVDLAAIAERAAASPRDAWIVAVEVDDAGRFGTVVLDGDSVVRFEEKSGANVPGTINAGIYVLPRGRMESGPYSLERDSFPRWAAEGRLRAVRARARFIDIGTPDSLQAAQTFFA